MPLLKDWSILTTSSDIMDTDGMSFSRDGFFAVLYVNHTNQVQQTSCAFFRVLKKFIRNVLFPIKAQIH
jgi:hypothetical protein